MANIIFPINPATGSEYLAPENGATYVFNGDRWVIFGQNLNGLATTGSNELSGSQYISGSVIIEGNLLTFTPGLNIIMTSGSLGYDISVDPVFNIPVEVRNDFMNGNASVSPGSTAHAEGNQSTAVGPFSHAEGFFTTSVGIASHAEGNSTTSVGNYSHAEGEGTISTADFSHVEGFYNVEDPNAIWIVGNGTSNSSRSNIIAAFPTEVQISGSLVITNLPTSDPGIPGALWRSGADVKISI
jgi:hypothetical protein